ncbi:SEL1-like repeat protein [Chitinibacter fontanus]|uniref:SEL1-like repeat protein n=1 Tax=Chitinibacter fontanus TaxID=1737446 RepID=UPI001D14850D|nr:sel1 repeat family protein [Chitinibacter fontanus]
MPKLEDVKFKLAFTCAYEKDHVPALPPEADVLFKYARYLERENLLKRDVQVNAEIARLYRIAAANGHWKANVNLQLGLTADRFEGLMSEVLDLNDALVKQNIPAGYYHMGHFLEKGTGYDQDHELALRYFRKSADMGSPEGQYFVAEKLAPINIAPNVAKQMWRCAAEQGHAEAAESLATDLHVEKNYADASVAYQLAVKAGSSMAASVLQGSFSAPKTEDSLDYLGQEKDDERVQRYKIIGKFLSDYYYLKPTMDDIDEIVPLPPAPLPKWDGKIKWLTEYEANIAPTKPDEVLITKLAQFKGLDPKTGLTLVQK